MKAVLRRVRPAQPRAAPVRLEPGPGRPHRLLRRAAGALTYKEYELLRLFLSHPGMAFTRDQLMAQVWGTDYYGETRTVDMHIRTLRQKLGPYGSLIQTVRNVGYRLEEQG